MTSSPPSAGVSTGSPAGRCPACGDAARHLTDWPFSGLGDSVFNYVAAFNTCDQCGLVYVANQSDDLLARFYAEECAYFSSGHFDITAAENVRKFQVYQGMLGGAGLHGGQLLDVGCGRGGFLRWLGTSTWSGKCLGVDPDARSIPDNDTRDARMEFRQGFAFDLPVDDASQDVVTYFHVLEHLRNLDRALDEAWRVTRPGGHLLIDVPDAENYATMPIGTGFWIGIREHVNHFSPAALDRLLQRKGFQVTRVVREILSTPEFTYPSLLVLARKGSRQLAAVPPYDEAPPIAPFVLESRRAMQIQAQHVTAILDANRHTTIWGCSAQLFSLLPLLDVSRISLCDGSPLKRTSRFKELAIAAPDQIAPEGALIVAPYLHRQAIRQAALALGWPPRNVHHLE